MSASPDWVEHADKLGFRSRVRQPEQLGGPKWPRVCFYSLHGICLHPTGTCQLIHPLPSGRSIGNRRVFGSEQYAGPPLEAWPIHVVVPECRAFEQNRCPHGEYCFSCAHDDVLAIRFSACRRHRGGVSKGNDVFASLCSKRNGQGHLASCAQDAAGRTASIDAATKTLRPRHVAAHSLSKKHKRQNQLFAHLLACPHIVAKIALELHRLPAELTWDSVGPLYGFAYRRPAPWHALSLVLSSRACEVAFMPHLYAIVDCRSHAQLKRITRHLPADARVQHWHLAAVAVSALADFLGRHGAAATATVLDLTLCDSDHAKLADLGAAIERYVGLVSLRIWGGTLSPGWPLPLLRHLHLHRLCLDSLDRLPRLNTLHLSHVDGDASRLLGPVAGTLRFLALSHVASLIDIVTLPVLEDLRIDTCDALGALDVLRAITADKLPSLRRLLLVESEPDRATEALTIVADRRGITML